MNSKHRRQILQAHRYKHLTHKAEEESWFFQEGFEFDGFTLVLLRLLSSINLTSVVFFSHSRGFVEGVDYPGEAHEINGSYSKTLVK